jgi:hypothetical protein
MRIFCIAQGPYRQPLPVKVWGQFSHPDPRLQFIESLVRRGNDYNMGVRTEEMEEETVSPNAWRYPSSVV